ncbi:MAG: PHP domain-containing protein [Nanoarchaeota archaeon]|nr:PHP domain-containing protein [Nanoarchaeota archaeon]
MQEKYIDLHMHTTASDGFLNPEQILRLAIEKNLSAIALTDHDTIANVEEAIKLGKELGIEVISGVEISVDDVELGFLDVHIVGLFIDIYDKNLTMFLADAQKHRLEQKKAMVRRLNELGYSITFEQADALAKGELGRPHLARVLMANHPDKFPTMDSVFKNLLGTGKKAYVSRRVKIKLQTAIKVIKDAGGIPILAHPAVYAGIEIDFLIRKFAELGGIGIETYYPYDKFKLHKGISQPELQKLIGKYKKTCEEFGLIESGGSDFHGTEKVNLGDIKVPYSVLEKMKEFIRKDKNRNHHHN